MEVATCRSFRSIIAIPLHFGHPNFKLQKVGLGQKVGITKRELCWLLNLFIRKLRLQLVVPRAPDKKSILIYGAKSQNDLIVLIREGRLQQIKLHAKVFS
jgi:hypothetical protein